MASLLLTCLHAFGRSTPAFDRCVQLTYRIFSLTEPLALTWNTLYAQHGPFPEKPEDNVTVQAFRTTSLRELKKATFV